MWVLLHFSRLTHSGMFVGRVMMWVRLHSSCAAYSGTGGDLVLRDGVGAFALLLCDSFRNWW
jgi:hypothetical protein